MINSLLAESSILGSSLSEQNCRNSSCVIFTARKFSTSLFGSAGLWSREGVLAAVIFSAREFWVLLCSEPWASLCHWWPNKLENRRRRCPGVQKVRASVQTSMVSITSVSYSTNSMRPQLLQLTV